MVGYAAGEGRGGQPWYSKRGCTRPGHVGHGPAGCHLGTSSSRVEQQRLDREGDRVVQAIEVPLRCPRGRRLALLDLRWSGRCASGSCHDLLDLLCRLPVAVPAPAARRRSETAVSLTSLEFLRPPGSLGPTLAPAPRGPRKHRPARPTQQYRLQNRVEPPILSCYLCYDWRVRTLPDTGGPMQF